MLTDSTITCSQVINFIFSREITPNEPSGKWETTFTSYALFIPHLPEVVQKKAFVSSKLPQPRLSCASTNPSILPNTNIYRAYYREK